MVVKLSDRVGVQWFRQVLPTTPQEGDDEIAVSNVGIIAAAQVIPITGGEPFIAVSMYARWFRPHPTVRSPYIYSDAAAHHIISDPFPRRPPADPLPFTARNAQGLWDNCKASPWPGGTALPGKCSDTGDV